MHIPCEGVRIALDRPGGDVSFLSHAHSDHTSGLRRQPRIIASAETLELAGLDAELATVQNAKLLDAGHILGSRQLLVDSGGVRTAYTGDISLKPNVFGWKAEIPQCDRLIMEATYGDPSYVFPPHGEVRGMISRWVRGNDSANLLIGCYELGKAQELIRMLNEEGVAPVITGKAAEFSSVYAKYGVRLDFIAVGTPEAEEALPRRFVALLPMAKAKRRFALRLAQAFGRDTLCAVATGWALHHRFDADAAFPLSDHADFNDLVSFVEQSGARDVEFFCGDGSKVLAARKQAILNS